MRSIRNERLGSYMTGDRRTNSTIKPILFLMLELIIFGLVMMVLYDTTTALFSETVAYTLMGAFGLWSLYFIKESSIPRFIKVYKRAKQNKYEEMRQYT